MPVVLTQAEIGRGADLSEWIAQHRGEVRSLVGDAGAVLFRDCTSVGSAVLARIAAALGIRLREYTFGNSPRRDLGAGIYTSTEYPAHAEISLHNELSYSPAWPEVLLFACAAAASEGGETPLADWRRMRDRLPPLVWDRFASAGLRYTWNLHGGRGLGRSWQEALGTTSPEAAEEVLDRLGVAYGWSGARLRVTIERPATVHHPITNDLTWFNQAEQWHPSSAGVEAIELLGIAGLPHSCCFGDGSTIPDTDISSVREAGATELVPVAWKEHDVLIIDNVTTAHGRRPFRGSRSVLAAMGDYDEERGST